MLLGREDKSVAFFRCLQNPSYSWRAEYKAHEVIKNVNLQSELDDSHRPHPHVGFCYKAAKFFLNQMEKASVLLISMKKREFPVGLASASRVIMCSTKG